jgi:hypothetical protein
MAERVPRVHDPDGTVNRRCCCGKDPGNPAPARRLRNVYFEPTNALDDAGRCRISNASAMQKSTMVMLSETCLMLYMSLLATENDFTTFKGQL